MTRGKNVLGGEETSDPQHKRVKTRSMTRAKNEGGAVASGPQHKNPWGTSRVRTGRRGESHDVQNVNLQIVGGEETSGPQRIPRGSLHDIQPLEAPSPPIAPAPEMAVGASSPITPAPEMDFEAASAPIAPAPARTGESHDVQNVGGEETPGPQLIPRGSVHGIQPLEAASPPIAPPPEMALEASASIAPAPEMALEVGDASIAPPAEMALEASPSIASALEMASEAFASIAPTPEMDFEAASAPIAPAPEMALEAFASIAPAPEMALEAASAPIGPVPEMAATIASSIMASEIPVAIAEIHTQLHDIEQFETYWIPIADIFTAAALAPPTLKDLGFEDL